MGIEDLKFRLASQYVPSTNTGKTEEGKGKKEVKTEEAPKQQQTIEVGDKLLTEDPKMAVMRDLGFIKAGQVNTSPEATMQRAQTYFETAPEMAALNRMFGIETERPYTVRGVDNDKLDKYLAKGLSDESSAGVLQFMDQLVALG